MSEFLLDTGELDAALELIDDGGGTFGLNLPTIVCDDDIHSSSDVLLSNDLALGGAGYQLGHLAPPVTEVDATLAFLDECDMDIDALAAEVSSSQSSDSSSAHGSGVSTSSSDTDSSGAATSLAVVPADQRKRVRPKEELAKLRRQEHELTAKLRELRLETRRRVVKSSDGRSSAKNAMLFWERAVARQLLARTRSEEENKRLKMLLQAQMRQARQMQLAWSRRLAGAAEIGLDDDHVPIARRIPADNTKIFRCLLQEIDDEYAKLDSYHRKSPHMHHHGDDGIYHRELEHDFLLEHTETITVPFTVKAVQRAVWMSLATRSKKSSASFHRNYAYLSSDMLQTSASNVVKQTAKPFFLQTQVVSRKFIEQAQIVIISKAFIKPKALDNGQLLGVTYAETNVRIIKANGELDGTSTSMELRAAMTREIHDGPFAAHWRNGGGDQGAKRMWAQAIAGRNELLEEFLVDQSAPVESM